MTEPAASPRALHRHNRMRLTCPHCQGAAKVRWSHRVTATAREGGVECLDVAGCGWRGKFDMTITHTYAPAAHPRDGVHLPLSPELQRRIQREIGGPDSDEPTAVQARN